MSDQLPLAVQLLCRNAGFSSISSTEQVGKEQSVIYVAHSDAGESLLISRLEPSAMEKYRFLTDTLPRLFHPVVSYNGEYCIQRCSNFEEGNNFEILSIDDIISDFKSAEEFSIQTEYEVEKWKDLCKAIGLYLGTVAKLTVVCDLNVNKHRLLCQNTLKSCSFKDQIGALTDAFSQYERQNLLFREVFQFDSILFSSIYKICNAIQQEKDSLQLDLTTSKFVFHKVGIHFLPPSTYMGPTGLNVAIIISKIIFICKSTVMLKFLDLIPFIWDFFIESFPGDIDFQKMTGFVGISLLIEVQLCLKSHNSKEKEVVVWLKKLFALVKSLLSYPYRSKSSIGFVHRLKLMLSGQQTPVVSVMLVTKYPIPGRCKTRLIPSLGEIGASNLAKSFFHDLITQISLLVKKCENCPYSIEPVVLFAPKEKYSEMKALVKEYTAHNISWRVKPFLNSNMLTSNLGDKLGSSLFHENEKNWGPVLFIGMDTPQISHSEIFDAISTTLQGGVFISPAKDGGYVLLGLPAFSTDNVFQNVSWSAANTFSSQIQSLQRSGYLNIKVGNEFFDIDEYGDLLNLYELFKTNKQLCHTLPYSYKVCEQFCTNE